MPRLAPLAALLVAVPIMVGTASASTPRHFKNCTAVHHKYKHGIAKSWHAVHTADGLTGTPKVSRKLYNANSRVDRDKDGVACER
jgi:hypothetical protein